MTHFQVLTKSQKKQEEDMSINGNFFYSNNRLYREVMPKLLKKHRNSAEKVRSSILLLNFLHSMKYGGGKKNIEDDLIGWSWVNNQTIIEHTGIGINQLKSRKEFLVEEGLLIIDKRQMKTGNKKDYYLPLYYPNHL